MTRLTTVVAACLAASALATSAYAQSQAEIAEKLNEEGKTLMFSGKYAEASAKLRAAVARVPEPRYFFNLCTSLFQEGKFGEALTACNAVANNNPSADQRSKADKLATRIKDEAKAQKVSIEPVGGGGGSTDDPALDCNATPDDARCQPAPLNDVCKTNPQDPSCGGNPNHVGDPNHGGDPNQGRYAVGRPPSGTGVFVSTTPDNKYTWTLGFEGFLGGGVIGQPDYYGSLAQGFRIKGDYLLNARARFGAQLYLQYMHFGEGAMDSPFVDTLDIFDLGIAAYKHLCVAQRLCLTPLAGLQLAMMSPAGEGNEYGEQVFNYAALGGRVELGAQYAFGTRYEHVLGVMAGVNLYSQVLAGPADDSGMVSIRDAGLDRGGAAAYLGIGYTYRFRTPLGSSPFVTLE